MPQNKNVEINLEELYAESAHHVVNTGEEKIHAKRMDGKFRKLKWLTMIIWVVFFLGPYVRWGDRQAILLDIGNRQFHFGPVTVLPQDFWILSLLLLFFAILLAVGTAMAGRVYCGYFCFQTIWTDVFTWIENKLEGMPAKRKKLDKAKLNLDKLKKRTLKYTAWLIISVLTGVSFVAWFSDVFQLWTDIVTLQATSTEYGIILMFILGTFYLAGFLREQACFWLCPYARIQAVMIDETSIVPSYDLTRGEPRGRIVKGKDQGDKGDCVDCNQCVAVCPTGVDIRNGQQEGCIMCALCIDACDSVMEKVGKDKGLIRYASWDEITGKKEKPILKRPRIWVYGIILVAAMSGVLWGMSTLDALELKVLHSRQPLFVLQSDGSIQNKYTLKILNKTTADINVKITAKGSDLEGMQLIGTEGGLLVKHGGVTPLTVYVKVPRKNLKSESSPIEFAIEGVGSDGVQFNSIKVNYFRGPRK